MSIYWGGIGSWDIRRLDGSFENCLQTVNTPSPQGVRPDGDEIVERDVDWWDPNLPPPPEDWLEAADFTLTPDESNYLRSRMVQSHPESMLAYLANQNRRVERVRRLWELAEVRARTLPPKLQRDVDHAEAFSTVMHGSMLLYNLILAQLASKEELADLYLEEIGTWRQTLQDREQLIDSWKMNEFWDLVFKLNPRVGRWTTEFVDSWCRLATDGTLVESSSEARTLISSRERRTKKSQARVDNRRALDMWSGSAGSEPLNFRWLNARRLLDDLVTTGGEPRA